MGAGGGARHPGTSLTLWRTEGDRQTWGVRRAGCTDGRAGGCADGHAGGCTDVRAGALRSLLLTWFLGRRGLQRRSLEALVRAAKITRRPEFQSPREHLRAQTYGWKPSDRPGPWVYGSAVQQWAALNGLVEVRVSAARSPGRKLQLHTERFLFMLKKLTLSSSNVTSTVPSFSCGQQQKP